MIPDKEGELKSITYNCFYNVIFVQYERELNDNRTVLTNQNLSELSKNMNTCQRYREMVSCTDCDVGITG
jgi:hypothetical protein